MIATALVASVPVPQAFKSGRDLAAWIGLVPRQNSTGGKERLGRISKAGNRYLRRFLVVGYLSFSFRNLVPEVRSPRSARGKVTRSDQNVEAE